VSRLARVIIIDYQLSNIGQQTVVTHNNDIFNVRCDSQLVDCPALPAINVSAAD